MVEQETAMFQKCFKTQFQAHKKWKKIIVTNSVIFWTTTNIIKDINSTKYSNSEYFS